MVSSLMEARGMGRQLKEDWWVSSLATSSGKWDALQRTDKKANTWKEAIIN